MIRTIYEMFEFLIIDIIMFVSLILILGDYIILKSGNTYKTWFINIIGEAIK